MGITGVQVDEIYSLDSDADLEAIKYGGGGRPPRRRRRLQ